MATVSISYRQDQLIFLFKTTLVEIFERVLKAPFHLRRNERSTRMRAFYLDGGHLIREDGRSQEQVIALPSALKPLPKSENYRGCRLLLISRWQAEMSDVSERLKLAFAKKELCTKYVDESYEIYIQGVYSKIPSVKRRSTEYFSKRGRAKRILLQLPYRGA